MGEKIVMSRNVKLFASVAIAALIAGGPTAFADGPDIETGNIAEGAANVGPVLNLGLITNHSLVGNGASEFVSASGADSFVGVTSINAGAPSVKTGNIEQGALNLGPVVNLGIITTNGDQVKGHGASVSVSASGARSAVSYTSIKNNNSKSNSKSPTVNTGNITQVSINGKLVANLGAIGVGNVSGNGASLSVNASGASAAVGMTSINDNKAPSVKTGNITQAALNLGPVVNAGIISAGHIQGTGASVGISATGAAAVASVSIMK
jgi:hypothetical protein